MFNVSIAGRLIDDSQYKKLGAYDAAQFAIKVKHPKDEESIINCTLWGRRFESILDTYKKSLDINLGTDHYQEVSARGNLAKSYTAILSSQGAGENLGDAIDEKEAIAEVVKALEAELDFMMNQPGSESLLEAIEHQMSVTGWDRWVDEDGNWFNPYFKNPNQMELFV